MTSVFWAPPFWFEPPEYGPPPGEPPAESGPPDQAGQEDSGLANQVADLTDEVQALRDEQASRQQAAPAPAPEKRLAAVLVYRDGHQAEVSDYALVGQTLWVFSGQRTRRVPLADVNLEATNRLNDSRGIDFALPTSR